MSTAQKLKTLDSFYNQAHAFKLLDALPQLIAVVEAADRQATLTDESRRLPMVRQELRPALAALDKALA